MCNNKVRSALTDMINIFYDVNVIRNSISHKLNTKNIYKRKKNLMSEVGLRKLFRINEIKILMSVTGLHNKATY